MAYLGLGPRDPLPDAVARLDGERSVVQRREVYRRHGPVQLHGALRVRGEQPTARTEEQRVGGAVGHLAQPRVEHVLREARGQSGEWRGYIPTGRTNRGPII
eukprot:1439085-Pyramimonas_sp.AAC.2